MATATLSRGTRARRAVVRRIRRHRNVKLALVLAAPLLWMTMVYILPLAYLLVQSLWQFSTVTYQVEQIWTLEYYYRVFSDPLWLHVLLRTAVMATLVTLSAVVLSVPLAYFLVRYTTRWRNVLYLACFSPCGAAIWCVSSPGRRSWGRTAC